MHTLVAYMQGYVIDSRCLYNGVSDFGDKKSGDVSCLF